VYKRQIEYPGGWDCSDWPNTSEPSNTCGVRQVGLKYANPWGLKDTLGNVAEWTWDWYDGYSAARATDPLGPVTGRGRSVRGCAWNFNAQACRSAFRYRSNPARRFYFIGLRAVRTWGSSQR